MSEEQALADARARITDYRNRIQNLDDNTADLLFREARNHNAWQDRDVSDDQLREIYDLLKFGSTSSNTQPARLIFIRSAEAKECLRPCLMPTNVDKTMAAPVTALLAYDLDFYTNFGELYPVRPEMGERFANDADVARHFSFQQITLQGAYLIMAARAMGLDCGPMSGFDNAKLDEAFFAGTTWRSNFLVNLGKGDPSKLFDRHPKFAFDEACQIA